ncbi:MAG: hypothetical protein OEY22_07075 [Candidatus Bathyarchaeota archaeon]|nr:hypothetical protein [Candidatus Bathyarchaeota archaeon]MDH5786746.1 hypothetical protein [Candidatus Bathyarchaeota archaeon]
MKVTPSGLLNVVLTTMLVAALFLTFAKGPIEPYDPWADPNDDGYIDVKDLLNLALRYGSFGDPTKPVALGSYNWSAGSYTLDIPGESGGNLYIMTAGYRQVTLGFKSPNYLDITTGFFLGRYYAYVDEFAISKPIVYPTENTMWIEPSEVALSAISGPFGIVTGQRFNVTVWINLNVESICWQFWMLYDKSILTTTAAGYTGTGGTRSDFFEKSGTANLFPLQPNLNEEYNATHNRTSHGETWNEMIPGNPYATGYGSLSWVEFEVIAEPPQGQEITTMIDISTCYNQPSPRTYALDPNGYEIPLSEVKDCLYTIDWSLLEYDVAKTYTITGPAFTIRFYNPNLINATLVIDYYMTT